MILGWEYEEAKEAIEKSPVEQGPIDWDRGISHLAVDYVLGEHGYFGHRIYISWCQQVVSVGDNPPYWDLKPDAVWPPEPFAPIHYATVQAGAFYHFVVMLADGTVLDPMRPGHFDLTCWPAVANVRGLVRA